VAAAGRGSNRVIEIRPGRELSDDRVHDPPLEITVSPPDGLDPVYAGEKMSRFQKFH
jgi:hypothetical protein